MSTPKKWTGERLETGIFTETTVEHLHRYALAMEVLKGKKILDIACGEGYGSSLLASVAASVTGVDKDKQVIRDAAEKYRKENLQFLEGDCTAIPCGDKAFDAVVSFETLEHVGEHDTMLEEIKRVLQPGGLLLISTPDKKNYSDRTGYQNPFHVKELYAGEFSALLQRHFKNIQVFNQQITLSSTITGGNAQGFTPYTGDFNAIRPDTGEDRLYCIALASDEQLPVLPNSIFNGNSILDSALEAREKMVTGTASYKLGHALLLPFKMIRKIFTRN